MSLYSGLKKRKTKAWFLIVLILSLDVHAARLKAPTSTESIDAHKLDERNSEREEVEALSKALSGMSQEEVRSVIDDITEAETELSRVFEVDLDPGSLISRVTHRYFHYSSYKYSLTLSPKVLLNLYKEDASGVEDEPYRSMEILPDSEITMRHGAHGPSVLVSGVETQATHKRSTWKFRFRGEAADEGSRTVEYLEQLLKDLQSATFFAMPTNTGPQLATCKLLQDDGTCFPRHACDHIIPKAKEPKGQECFPKTSDEYMAAAWSDLLRDLKQASEKVLKANCMKDCDEDWYFLTSHMQVARAVLDGSEAFFHTHPMLSSVLQKTAGDVVSIERGMARAVDRLPEKLLNSTKCKLPRTLEDLTLMSDVDDQTIEQATREYVKDCPELQMQVDNAIKQIEDVATNSASTSNSALIALREQIQSNSSLALALSGHALLQSSEESAFIELSVGMVLGALYLVLAAVLVGTLVYVVVYLILKIITAMVCSVLARLKSSDERVEFSKQCRAGGKKFAGWVSAFLGVGVGIFFGGPIAYTLISGGGAAGVAALLAPVGQLAVAPGAAFMSMAAPVTQTYWLSFGAYSSGQTFGLIASYGLSLFTVGKVNAMLTRWRKRRKDARTVAKEKKREATRMKEWKITNEVDYPWKKYTSDWYKNVETSEERSEKPSTQPLWPLPAPWKELWSIEKGRYWFWNPESKVKTLDRAKVMSGELDETTTITTTVAEKT
mmetsp:Transcript_92216/g.144763  ORF Transcript_92216/g.144763 Transcript_92216/m.144763 type:complete len:724 (+) Transcript_92216:42-2213(+)